MTDELLPYYDRELAFFRQMGADFATRYPKKAARLRLNEHGSEDPHVERMIEAFAYMNARIRYKLDDDFPELSEAVLNVLYPHFLAATPSMSIVELESDPDKGGDSNAALLVDRGTTIETEQVDDFRCRYRTCYPVEIWPLQIVNTELQSRPFTVPSSARSTESESVLHMRLRSTGPPVRELDVDKLRFYINFADLENATELYELLLGHTLEIVVARSADDPDAITLSNSRLRPIGFADEEAMLPFSARSFAGFRLLSEYFAFPQKFLFVELEGIRESQPLLADSTELSIYIHLDRTSGSLERVVDVDSLKLGCTPIINLFRQRADPFLMTERQSEYRVSADAHRESSLEIYSVEQVRVSTTSGEETDWAPFYSAKHSAENEAQHKYWYATRRARGSGSGTDTWLTFVDLDFASIGEAGATVIVDAMCLNRGLPDRLPFGGGRPRLNITEGPGDISARCLVRPTPTRRSGEGKRNRWRVVSHLSLNHLAVDANDESVAALREILKLYDVIDTPHSRDLIAGVVEIACTRGVARLSGAGGGFVRGLDVEVVFDEGKFSGSGFYLLASVLDRFLGILCSINSFSRLSATTLQGRDKGEQWKWPARAGDKPLL